MIMSGGIIGGAPRGVFFLDAGKSASYDGSAQKWLNTITSPNVSSGSTAQTAYDFWLGAGSGAESEDPTFFGAAGGDSSSEYFRTNGSGFFRSVGNQNFMDSLHKNNALFTFFALVKTPDASTTISLFGTQDISDTTNVGASLYVSGGVMRFVSANGNAVTPALSVSSSAGFVQADAYYALGVVVNEAAGTGFFYKRDESGATVETFTSTYTSPSSSGGAATLELLARGAGEAVTATGGRIYCAGMWWKALTQGEMNSLFNRYKHKIGL